MNINIFISVTFVILLSNNVIARTNFYETKRAHRAAELTDQQVKALSTRTDINHIDYLLDEILIPRVVGTPQHTKVADFIVNELDGLGWHVERNKFNDTTPIFGELEFENIIAKLNPNADRFLFLACHYDSKYSRENDFIGATDSAAPCAMMLNLAKVMQRELSETKKQSDVNLGFIFFDGEEAFQHWGPKDSIYGARHLASRWESESYTTLNRSVTNQLDRMDLLVLLDLLGASNPKFYSYFIQTERWYVRLANAEERLSEMGMLRGHNERYFVPSSLGAHIEDDHIPFMKRDVPILHIIPAPFPEVWHKSADDRSALDMDTIENLNKILRVFVSEYLHIKI